MSFYALSFVVGLLAGAILTFAAVRDFPRIGLLDFPERYGLKRGRLPYPGGLAFLALTLGIWWIDPAFVRIIPGLFLVGLVSFLDDRRQISVGLRTFFYLLAAAWVFGVGISIDFVGNPFAATNIELEAYPVLRGILTILWIFFIQQAMNWFDGIKGLCPGVSGIGFLTLGILGLIHPELFFDPAHQTLTMANLYLAGIVLGGWWFYLKGKIILGDTGSQTLGFLLAVMSIYSGAKIMTTLIVLALPLLDVLFVVVRRTFQDKKAFWKGDFRHMPHLIARQKGETPASLLLTGISLLFGILAISLTGLIKLIALSVVLVIIIGWWWMQNRETRIEKREENEK